MSLAHVAPLLACPVCGDPLTVDDPGRVRTLACRSGHSHDVAKQGHVNLLGHAAPANADTAEMVAARDRFLSAGHYAPIERAIVRRFGGCRSLVEVGAGTGHYLAAALDAQPDAVGVACDVSPAAARRAARAHERIGSVVADTWAGLPLRGGRVDGLLCVFAPRNPAEFARVVAAGGVLVVVTPNADHLRQARERLGLLDVEADKLARLNRSLLGLFEPVATQRIAWRMELSAAELADLVGMGPNAFHDHAVVDEALGVDADVQVSVFRRPSH